MSDLSPEQLFVLGIERAERDLAEMTAAIRVAEDAGHISHTEAADKRIGALVAYREELARLRARYL